MERIHLENILYLLPIIKQTNKQQCNMMNPVQFKRTADLLRYKALFTSEGEKFSNPGKAQNQSVWFQPSEISLPSAFPPLLIQAAISKLCCHTSLPYRGWMVHSFLLYILLRPKTRVGNCKKLLKSLRLTLVYFQVSANIAGSCNSCMCYYECHRKPQTSRRHTDHHPWTRRVLIALSQDSKFLSEVLHFHPVLPCRYPSFFMAGEHLTLRD